MAQAERSVQKHRLALVAAGSNLASTHGESHDNILSAFHTICQKVGGIVSISRLFRTPAYPPGSGPDFVNAACAARTKLTPRAFLDVLHGIEAEAGRVRNIRWGARTLDLDLIALDGVILPDATAQKEWMALAPERQGLVAPAELILPHPRMQDRAFVLIPLGDICPGWHHPVTGLSVRDMLAALPEADKAAIRPL